MWLQHNSMRSHCEAAPTEMHYNQSGIEPPSTTNQPVQLFPCDSSQPTVANQLAHLSPDINITSTKRAFRRRSSNRFIIKAARQICQSKRPKSTKQLTPIRDTAQLSDSPTQSMKDYLASELLDTKQQLRNECKTYLITKMETLEETLESLKRSLLKTERENHQLKTTVGELKKSVAFLQGKVDTYLSSATIPITHPPKTSISSKPSPSTKHSPTSPPAPPLIQQDTEFPPLPSDKRPPPPSLTTSFSKVVSGVNNMTTLTQPVPRTSNKPAPQDTENKTIHASKRMSPPPTDNGSQYTIPVSNSNRFAPLSDPSQQPVPTSTNGDNTIPVHVSDRTTRRPHHSSTELSEAIISDKTDYLIIGDSVLSYLDPVRMNTGSFTNPQKICVGGLTAADLTTWLQSLHSYASVTRLVIHVGVNDCKGGAISTPKWSNLLSQCKRRFPSAVIIASSILPARGRHPVNQAISQSNFNLEEACRHQQAMCVPHYTTFVAKSQAPKKALYADCFHPSRLGLLKLARNLKYPESAFGTSESSPEICVRGASNSRVGSAERGGPSRQPPSPRPPYPHHSRHTLSPHPADLITQAVQRPAPAAHTTQHGDTHTARQPAYSDSPQALIPDYPTSTSSYATGPTPAANAPTAHSMSGGLVTAPPHFGTGPPHFGTGPFHHASHVPALDHTSPLFFSYQQAITQALRVLQGVCQ